MNKEDKIYIKKYIDKALKEEVNKKMLDYKEDVKNSVIKAIIIGMFIIVGIAMFL